MITYLNILCKVICKHINSETSKIIVYRLFSKLYDMCHNCVWSPVFQITCKSPFASWLRGHVHCGGHFCGVFPYQRDKCTRFFLIRGTNVAGFPLSEGQMYQVFPYQRDKCTRFFLIRGTNVPGFLYSPFSWNIPQNSHVHMFVVVKIIIITSQITFL